MVFLRFITVAAVFLFAQNVFAQQALFVSGTVTDQAGRPVAGCSVYFSTTSKGGVTSPAGEFTLKNLPEGKYELVVSAIGYQTYVLPVSSTQYPHALKVQLTANTSELDEVVVEPYDKNGWRRWGKEFTDNFIGTTLNAWQCKLTNPEVLRFRFNRPKNLLTAKASEPLILENALLGYTIKFQLEEFTYHFDDNIVVYLGYPLFTEMAGKDAKQESKWIRNRKDAYYGSLLHFMRAAYRDRLAADGYLIMANVDGKETTLHSLDGMMTKNADGSKRLFFNDKLQVIYNHIVNRISETSEIYLDPPEGIDIQANGSYYSPKSLVANSHWGKYEKLANMLPFDYTP